MKQPRWSMPATARSAVAVAVILGGLLVGVAHAQTNDTRTSVTQGAATLGPFEPILFSGDLRDLPKVEPWQPGDPITDAGDKLGPKTELRQPINPPGWTEDPLLERQRSQGDESGSAPALTAPLQNFDGIDFQGVNPSDPVMDVGKRYIIAASNGSIGLNGAGGVFVVHDKETGVLLAGPSRISSLSPTCVPVGFSDPIVMYDEIAERWMMAEISVALNNVVCLHVSQTDDPLTGGWLGYAIPTPSIPDYPKFGIWSDGYYMTTNELDGPAAYAMDRSAIEQGLPLVVQRTVPTAPPLDGFGFQALTPSDLDGKAQPPQGSPNFLVRHRDDEVHNPSNNDPTQDFIELWEYDVDFLVPANTTLTGPINIAVSEFSSEICGLTAFACFPQPNTGTTLDPLREVMMFRWVYRNFGTHETLLGNLVTDVDGTEHGGVRWIELRRTPGFDWELHQEGTFAPDADHRWIGAIAMDGDGNIAVSYSVSSENTFPAFRYTGRLATDPPGVLTQGEFSIIESTASNASNRWGDYANTVVDPVDNCTFWTTNNYVNPNTTWHTRVASFRFLGCNDLDLDGVPNDQDNCTLVPNPSQCDTNGDLFGNHCDADLDNNGIVDKVDRKLLIDELGATGPNDADLDCNEVVNQEDLRVLRESLGQPPGPSGLVSQ